MVLRGFWWFFGIFLVVLKVLVAFGGSYVFLWFFVVFGVSWGLFFMVLGDPWWFFEVLGGSRNFLVVFGGSRFS